MKKIIVSDRVRQYIGFELYPVSEDVEVFTAYSNENALDLHRKNRGHLVITELYGLGMSAVRLCSLIREDPDLRDVSVIVCCRDNEIELAESRNCRANAVITLPIELRVLRQAVQELLSIPARAEYRIPFSARCFRLSPNAPFECELENISVTGMLIRAKAALQQGDRINCALALPAAGPFQAQAEVIRTAKISAERTEYGLRFSRLDPPARRAIETIVLQHRNNEARAS